MGSRSNFEFRKEKRFDKSVRSLGLVNYPLIIADVSVFEREYRVSNLDEELPTWYDFKHIGGERGSYTLRQIRLGPNKDYRATLMFPNGRPYAYWITAFKKGKQNERQEIELAKSRAKDLWIAIKDND